MNEFAGWTGGNAYWHACRRVAVEGRVETVCGTKLPPIVKVQKKKGGPGCARCMAWAKKNGIKP
jgi:hypothetical protein